MKHYASVSFGKDSLCMLFMLIEKNYSLDEVVFFDTGMEFQAIYDTRDKVLPILTGLNVKFTTLYPEESFLWNMFERPVKSRETGLIHKYGYSWCGGICRWGTSQKLKALKAYTGDGMDYVGIAADEIHRFGKENRPNRILPLRDLGVVEADALQYCYNMGFTWEEDNQRLYALLDRVSCWCCGNKNLKELRNIYLHLPQYWEKLKELQKRTERPYYRRTGETISDLEKRFIIINH